MSDTLVGGGMAAFAVGTILFGLAAAGVAPPPAGALAVLATILGGVLVVAGAILGGEDSPPAGGREDRERENREPE
jgi:hypothetical protein